MKKLHTCNTLMEAQHLKGVLEASGIATMIKNEHVFGALGQVPLKELMPQVWILDEAELDGARQLLAQVLDPAPSSAPAWRCGACGEHLEAQFDVCWQCGARRPGTD